MAELDEPADEPNFDLFGSFGLDFFSFSCDNAAAPASEEIFKGESCHSLTATMNFKQTFIILFENFIVYMSRRYFLDFETA